MKTSWRYLCKRSWRRLEDVFKTSWTRFCKTSWRRFEDVLKTSWRRLEDVLETSWRRIAKTNILVLVLTKMSWKRLEDVLWRRMTKANIFVLIKTSWRRLHQDECLVGHYFLLIFPEKYFARTVSKPLSEEVIVMRSWSMKAKYTKKDMWNFFS